MRVLHFWRYVFKTAKMAQELFFHALGVLLGRSGALLGCVCVLLGRSWGSIRGSWVALRRPWGSINGSWVALGGFSKAPGRLNKKRSAFRLFRCASNIRLADSDERQRRRQREDKALLLWPLAGVTGDMGLLWPQRRKTTTATTRRQGYNEKTRLFASVPGRGRFSPQAW